MRKKSVNVYFSKLVSTKEKIDLIKATGFDEFFTSIHVVGETMGTLEQIEYAKSLGLGCSMVHCQYNPEVLKNFWEDGDAGEDVLNYYLSQIHQLAGANKNFVVHLNNSKDCPLTEIGLVRIKKLLSACEIYDMNLCIENLFSYDEIPYVFKNIKHPNLKICLDIGHQNFLTPEFQIIEEYGEHVAVLHVHDNDGVHDLHDIPFTGTIDWERFAKGLAKYPDIVLSVENKSKNPDVKDQLEKIYKSLEKLDKLVK